MEYVILRWPSGAWVSSDSPDFATQAAGLVIQYGAAVRVEVASAVPVPLVEALTPVEAT